MRYLEVTQCVKCALRVKLEKFGVVCITEPKFKSICIITGNTLAENLKTFPLDCPLKSRKDFEMECLLTAKKEISDKF